MTTASTPERRTCRICGTTGNFSIYMAREMMFGTRASFPYFGCSSCECLQIANIPEDLTQYYPKDYYSQQLRLEPTHPSRLQQAIVHWYCRSAVIRSENALEAAIRRTMTVPYDLRNLGSYLLHSKLSRFDERILDVGCGTSPHRLAAMKRCGFPNVEGIDPFIASDTDYHGIQVRRCRIQDVDGIFGFVMFHHSLEHVHRPAEDLAHAARILRTAGVCLVRIPVMGTALWQRYGVNWVELDAPRHLHLLSRRTVNLLAEMTGFRVIRVEFDSSGWELAWSELYAKNRAMKEADDARSPSLAHFFDVDQLERFEEEARRLNSDMQGGRACFYLQKL